FLIGDKLLSLPVFEDLKPLLLIALLVIVNLMLLYVTVGALLKAFGGGIKKSAQIVQSVKYLL
ncbi:MAG TPA: hypothetical protein VJK72_05580, partial [Candidatus Nanoarchaeia archaeon]|nr:hypothetical protein [Candidatus Nanoarchaeia archaeon]